jgi:hypothetical protein
MRRLPEGRDDWSRRGSGSASFGRHHGAVHFRERAAAMWAEMAAYGGPACAVDLLEELGATRGATAV